MQHIRGLLICSCFYTLLEDSKLNDNTTASHFFWHTQNNKSKYLKREDAKMTKLLSLSYQKVKGKVGI